MSRRGIWKHIHDELQLILSNNITPVSILIRPNSINEINSIPESFEGIKVIKVMHLKERYKITVDIIEEILEVSRYDKKNR